MKHYIKLRIEAKIVAIGDDGDYNGKSMGLYKLTDNGATFEYVKDVM